MDRKVILTEMPRFGALAKEKPQTPPKGPIRQLPGGEGRWQEPAEMDSWEGDRWAC